MENIGIHIPQDLIQPPILRRRTRTQHHPLKHLQTLPQILPRRRNPRILRATHPRPPRPHHPLYNPPPPPPRPLPKESPNRLKVKPLLRTHQIPSKTVLPNHLYKPRNPRIPTPTTTSLR